MWPCLPLWPDLCLPPFSPVTSNFTGSEWASSFFCTGLGMLFYLPKSPCSPLPLNIYLLSIPISTVFQRLLIMITTLRKAGKSEEGAPVQVHWRPATQRKLAKPSSPSLGFLPFSSPNPHQGKVQSLRGRPGRTPVLSLWSSSSLGLPAYLTYYKVVFGNAFVYHFVLTIS